MSHLRLAARLASRELRSRRWRTLLVAAFVAVPVSGMIVFDVGARTFPLDETVAESGQADLFVRGPAAAPVIERLAPGSRLVRIESGRAELRSRRGRRYPNVLAGDLTDPVARGLAPVLDGRLPARPGEVAMSPSLRRALGLEVGDRVRLRGQHTAFDVHLVGETAEPTDFRSDLLVLRSLPPHLVTDVVELRSLIDVPGRPSAAALRRLVARADAAAVGVWAPSLSTRDTSSRQEAVLWSYVGGALVLLVAGIVITAAFAVGARRQLHTLGQLAANGARPLVLRDILLIEGAMSGGVGVVLGATVAAVTLAALAPHRNWLVNGVADHWVLRPLDLVPIVVLGVVAAVLASVQPARAAARLSVLGALGGQAPAGRLPSWLVPVGTMSFVGGTGLLVLATAATGAATVSTVATAVAILGGVGVVLGATTLAPVVIARLEPLAARLRGTWRLAARSLARARARSSAVVAALAASATLVLVVSAGTLSFDAWNAEHKFVALPAGVVRVGSPTPGAVADVAKVLDHPTQVTYDVLAMSGSADAADAGMAVATPELLRFLGLGPDAEAALAADRPIVVGTADAPAASVPLSVGGPPVVVDGAPADFGALPRVLLPPSLVAELGAPTRTVALLRSASDLTNGQRRQLVTLAEDAVGGTTHLWSPTRTSNGAAVQGAALVLSLLFALVVVAVGLGLSAAESRAEREVLVALGASPRSTRGLAGAKATTLAALGGLLAVPTALVPMAVVLASLDRDVPLRVPWLMVGLVVVVVPVVAGVATQGCSAIGGRVRPVRASTFAVD